MSAGEIVNMLEKGWKVIEDNKPSSQLKTARANAVPNVPDWTSLEGAQGPKESRWYISMINRLPESWGNIVVDCDLYLRFTYGATYKGGGLYIPNIWIDIDDSYVAWFHTLELDLIAKDPENAGTASAPLARIPITISGKMVSTTTSITVQRAFMVWGNGRLDVL